MKYGHVGRPTNEEVQSKKRKKLLMFIVPVFLLLAVVGVIASQGGLNGVMGNSVISKRGCPDDGAWHEEDGNVCIKQTEKRSQLSAYILGDAYTNGVINEDDTNAIKQALKNGTQLNAKQKIIYDYDQSGVVDSNDVTELSEAITYAKSIGEAVELVYVCPEDEEEKVIGTDQDGVTTSVAVYYSPIGDGKKCAKKTVTTEEYEYEDNSADEPDEEDEPEISITEVSAPSNTVTYGENQKLTLNLRFENYQTGDYYFKTRTYFGATNTDNGWLGFVGECQKVNTANKSFDLTMNNTGRYGTVTVYDNSSCSDDSEVYEYTSKLYSAVNTADLKTDKTFAKYIGAGISFKLYMPNLAKADKKKHRLSIYYQVNDNKEYYAKWAIKRMSDNKLFGDECKKIVNGMFDTHNIIISGNIKQSVNIYRDSQCTSKIGYWVNGNNEYFVPGVAKANESNAGGTLPNVAKKKTTPKKKTKKPKVKYKCNQGKKKGKKCKITYKAHKDTTSSCPSGYKVDGKKCKSTTTATSEKKCTEGKLNNGKCIQTAAAITQTGCPDQYSNVGNKCQRTLTMKAEGVDKSCYPGYTRSADRQTCTKVITQNVSTYTKCPSGYTRSLKSIKECEKTTKPVVKKSCPSGYRKSGSKCIRKISPTKTTRYSCPNGGTLSGTNCVKTVDATKEYKCSKNYTLSGNVCVQN